MRLATRAAEIKAECAVPWLVLDLAIKRGKAKLATINGLLRTNSTIPIDLSHPLVGVTSGA